MNKRLNASLVILFAILLTALFHKQAFGLNLLIAEVLFFSWLIMSKQFSFKGLYPLIVGIGLMASSLFTVITHSVFSYILNFIVLLVFIGLLIYPQAKSILMALGQAFSNLIYSQKIFFEQVQGTTFKGRNLGSYIWKVRIFIIPVLIIFLFIFIYRNSNPVFDGLVVNAGFFLHENLGFLFRSFDFILALTFLICLGISIFIFIRATNPTLIKIDSESEEVLHRKNLKQRRHFQINALKNEYKAGIFLLLVLNLLLLILNIIDIKWVWFGFEWEGQYLKQFVHEGTYLLILSILISIVLILYFFRRNLNFYPNNEVLKYLGYLWLFQNGILAISVAIRNFWYIHYFALAYKRIGVIIFLILTIYGLYTVFIKVHKKKSFFYLVKNNSFVFLIVLLLSSTINWDSVIAKYNFNNAHDSFLHLDYLSTLSDKSLPYLKKSMTELNELDTIQKEKFPFERDYMSPEEYFRTIEAREEKFIRKWESKSILSWNLPEYLAYKKLKELGK